MPTLADPYDAFTCAECLETFESRGERDNHYEDTKHRQPARSCPAPKCKEVREGNFELWEHMEVCAILQRTKRKGVSLKDLYYFCRYCDELEYGRDADYFHECNGYQCLACTDVYVTLSAVTAHILRRLLDEEQDDGGHRELYRRVAPLDRCGYLRRLKIEPYVPERQIEDDIHRKMDHYECHLCSAEFQTKWDLKEHFWSHAHASYQYRCKLCSEVFKQLDEAISHLEVEDTACMKLMRNLDSTDDDDESTSASEISAS